MERLYDLAETRVSEAVKMAPWITEVLDTIRELRRATLEARWLEPINSKKVLSCMKDLKAFLGECNIFGRRVFGKPFIASTEVDGERITFSHTPVNPPHL